MHKVKITANFSCLHTLKLLHPDTLHVITDYTKSFKQCHFLGNSLLNSIWKHQPNSGKVTNCSTERFLKKTPHDNIQTKKEPDLVLEESNLIWPSLFDPGIFTSTDKKGKGV